MDAEYVLKRKAFSQEHLKTYLSIKAPEPDLMLAQFALETGWFNSKLFREANNLAGMKLPKRRQTTASGELNGYAKYDHWTDSVDDFLLWLEFHDYKGDYLNFLKKIGYAQDEKYIQKIENIAWRLEK